MSGASGKTWFITGGTGGFGLAFADAALEVGDQVVLTARRPAELAAWAAPHGDRVLVLPLDVTDPEQLQSAVGDALDRFGAIDILVNNAGRGWYGSIEGTPDETVRRSFELNFFAVLAVIRAVLPSMRARRDGWIVNVSSVAGLRGVTGFGYYSAAKAALESVTEVLRREVEPFGISVLAVEPGAFRTGAYAGFVDEPVAETVADYVPLVEKIRAGMVEQDGHQPGDPRRGACAVIAAMNQHPAPHRLVLGATGFDTAVSSLRDAIADIQANETLSRGADYPD